MTRRPRSRPAISTPTCTGQKLRGRFILVRRGEPDRSGKEQWLLLHKHDEYAVKGWNPEDYPESVLSGRTNDEVKADPDRMWRSDLPPVEGVGPGQDGGAPAGRADGCAQGRRARAPGAPPSGGKHEEPDAGSDARPRTSSPRWTRSDPAAPGRCSAAACG